MLQSLGMGLPEEEIWECFQSFDLNSTGDISLLEFT
jgi:Ca2+-binding EF-hand superfamily protein